MADGRNNYRDNRDQRDRRDYWSNDRRHRPTTEFKEIDHWTQIRNIVDRARESGKSYVELRIDAERPEFTDGTHGYYRLNTLIQVDERFSLRLSTSALAVLRRFFYEHDEDIMRAVTKVRRMNALIDEMLADEQDRNRFEGLDQDADAPDQEGEEADELEGEEPEGEEAATVEEIPPAVSEAGVTPGRRRKRRAP